MDKEVAFTMAREYQGQVWYSKEHEWFYSFLDKGLVCVSIDNCGLCPQYSHESFERDFTQVKLIADFCKRHRRIEKAFLAKYKNK